ncbi:unnamed protein product [Adineta ricciae]|uniref:Uncharacterized protein n=1 Tax=Adineta ricciae TaxID=249248 RepID=A0A815W9F7_ADIRI|nr:unnamed protein product [Adineta ricciae]CAF1580380.1 unnamed protein product [Adineta ricciae]
MSLGRALHTASTLPNGQVLIAGGFNVNPLNAAELYNPSTGNWTTTASMYIARQNFAAVVLPNGKVLVAGGHNGTACSNTAELYQ